MSRSYHSHIERKSDGALTKVPTSYICNRCKGRGHYVSDCPTNEDPEYDISAGFDYICKFCKERGTHYFLFCPRNPDPNSIYRRRQERALQNLQGGPLRNELRPKRTLASSTEFRQSLDPSTKLRSNITVAQSSGPNADVDLFTKSKGTRPRNVVDGRLGNGSDTTDMERSMSDGLTRGTHQKNTAEYDESKMGHYETFRASDGDMFWERLKSVIQREHSKGSQEKSINSAKQFDIEQTATKLMAATTIHQLPHAAFLSELFTKHPSLPNPNWRPRMTALDMWDIHDEKKHQEEDAEEPKMNERALSSMPSTPDSSLAKNLTHGSRSSREDSIDVDKVEYSRAWEQRKEQPDILMGIMGIEDHDGQQEMAEVTSSVREEKVRVIQKKINSIEDLRTKLAAGEDLELPVMQQMASGPLSQEGLDEISRVMRAQQPSSPSGLPSSSSELSSPPRLSSSSSRRDRGGFRNS